MDKQTRYHRILLWFQDHRIFSWFLFLILVVVGAGTVTGSIDTILSIYTKYVGYTRVPFVKIKMDEVFPMPKQSYGYLYDVNGKQLENLSRKPDTLDHNNNSDVVLEEDGLALKQPHGSHQEIQDIGQGRYSHWLDDIQQEYLYFSTSDNTDPRLNERTYSVRTPNGKTFILEKKRIKKHEVKNHSYRYKGYGVTNLSPANEDCRGKLTPESRLVVIESEGGKKRELGPAHSPQRRIENRGEGRYNHCWSGTQSWLFFSSSDNTDPRSNGREYALTIKSQ